MSAAVRKDTLSQKMDLVVLTLTNVQILIAAVTEPVSIAKERTTVFVILGIVQLLSGRIAFDAS